MGKYFIGLNADLILKGSVARSVGDISFIGRRKTQIDRHSRESGSPGYIEKRCFQTIWRACLLGDVLLGGMGPNSRVHPV